MTRRDQWIVVALVLVVALLYLAFPRYEWRQATNGRMTRVDRWTGQADFMVPGADGQYVPYVRPLAPTEPVK
ncbi:MAG: hypothetical protein NT151_09500 [Acidobacteria bacterium]|nr:hypothetical protein [Acidobacteriota bacterium]